MSFDAGIDALTFTASGDEMVLAQANGVLLVSDMSGTAKFEVQAFGITAHVCAMSWQTDSHAIPEYFHAEQLAVHDGLGSERVRIRFEMCVHQ